MRLITKLINTTASLPIEILHICGNIAFSLSSIGYPNRLTTGVNIIVVIILGDKHQKRASFESSIRLKWLPLIKNIPTSYTNKKCYKLYNARKRANYITLEKLWSHGKCFKSALEDD